MEAYVDPAIISAVKKGRYTVNLTTTGTDPVAALECYTTVTGKFRDGTEQVLLIQKVLIPAIPGADGSLSDAEGLISVTPYYISDTYPAHGFKVRILQPDKVKSLGDATFEGGPRRTIDPISPKQLGDESSYDISPGTAGKDQWDTYPYPVEEGFWKLGELYGNITITLKMEDSSTIKVSVGPITIPPRQNIFQTKKYPDGIITYKTETNQISLSLPDFSSSLPTHHTLSDADKNIAYYFINSGTPTEAVSGKRNGELTLDESTLNQHMGQTLEAYVKVEVTIDNTNGKTYIWYRVASVSVDTLLNQ
jgi:hypothetical protein